MVDDMMMKFRKELSQMANHRHQNKQGEMKNFEKLRKASNGTDKPPTPKPSNQTNPPKNKTPKPTNCTYLRASLLYAMHIFVGDGDMDHFIQFVSGHPLIAIGHIMDYGAAAVGYSGMFYLLFYVFAA